MEIIFADVFSFAPGNSRTNIKQPFTFCIVIDEIDGDIYILVRDAVLYAGLCLCDFMA